jgi:hypothetical protein
VTATRTPEQKKQIVRSQRKDSFAYRLETKRTDLVKTTLCQAALHVVLYVGVLEYDDVLAPLP